MERLQKYIASCGIASRRKAEELITEGKVQVNGRKVTELGVKINPQKDKVKVNGQLLAQEKPVYYLLNKPKGVITSVSDPQGRETVLDYIKNETKRIYPIGRLDLYTEGLLLLTNDGVWGHSIINGHKHVPKVYYVEFEGKLSEEGIQRIKEGIVLGDGTQCKPALIKLLSDQSATITIEEGKYHQVKRMIGAAGGTVSYLKRLTIGHVDLNGIEEVGSVMDLTIDDVEGFKK